MRAPLLLAAALAAALVAALVGACTGLPGPLLPPEPAPALAPGGARSAGAADHDGAPAPRPEDFRAGLEVAVVLGRAENAEHLSLALPGAGRQEFTRAGALVLASDGRAARELAVEARSAVEGIAFDGRRYPGRMVVRAHPRGGLRLENRVDLERYVEGVVAAELALWSARPEELEAQAVAVRTYALFTLGRRRAERGEERTFLWDSVEDQAYRGLPETGDSAGGRAAARRLREAVEATRALVLVRDGRLEDARYCAACGGRTAEPTAVFERALPGPRPVPCAPCAERMARAAAGVAEAGGLAWEHTFEADALAAAGRRLDLGGPIAAVAPGRTDPTGRWLEAEVAGPAGRRTVALDDLRRALGFEHLRSAWITSTWPRAGEPIRSGWLVRGRGRGHGVGLCQEGARGYAERGWSARSILAHYYPGAALERLPH